MPELVPTEITKKSVVIVRFGPGGFPNDGFRPAEYYQVTIDPSHVSKSGEYIRLGQTPGDEIVGWQRVAALTVVEVLAEFNLGADALPEILTGHDSVTMTFLKA